MRARHLQALAGITALAAVLRFSTLDVQSFSPDEGVTVALLRDDFRGMLSTIPHTESTPPLYYVLAWVWTRAFGDGEVGLRSLSALLGTVTVPVVYAAARQLASARVGLVAAALTAVSPFLVWYSQEGRAYALLILLAATSLLLMARVRAEGAEERRTLALWALSCALALATHYYAVFLVAAEAALLAAPVRRRRDVLAAAGAALAVGAGHLPLALDQRETGNFTAFIDAIPLGQRVKEVPKKFLVGEQGTPGDYGSLVEALVPVAAVSAAVALGLLLGARGRERAGGLAALAVGGGAVAVPLLMALAGFDYFAAYLLIGAWPALAVAAAAGLAGGAGGRAGLAAAAVLGAAMLCATVAVPAGDELRRWDFRDAAEALGDPAGARVVVATPDSSFAPLAAYRDGLELLGERRLPVTEVVVLGMRSQDDSSLRPGAVEAARRPVPAFRTVERRDQDDFAIVRFRSARPVALTPAELGASGLGSAAPTLIVQR
jgi:mannosyltransferase